MTFTQKIKAAMGYSGLSQARVAENMGTSAQNFSAKLNNKADKYSVEELERIAAAMGADFQFSFKMKDGTVI